MFDTNEFVLATHSFFSTGILRNIAMKLINYQRLFLYQVETIYNRSICRTYSFKIFFWFFFILLSLNRTFDIEI